MDETENDVPEVEEESEQPIVIRRNAPGTKSKV
jgi:hypothetical protein